MDANRLPLTLRRKINEQPPSSRLPLPLVRKLGELDGSVIIVVPPDDTPKPKRRMGAVMTYHGSVLPSDDVALAYGAVRVGGYLGQVLKANWTKALKIQRDYHMAVMNFYAIANGGHILTNNPLLLYTLHQWQPPTPKHLIACQKTWADSSVYLSAYQPIAWSDKQLLKGCQTSFNQSIIHLTNTNSHQAHSDLIANSSTHAITHSTPVPCRFYPLPAPDPIPDVRACRLPPPSNRLPLALRRKRGNLPSSALPLSLVCWHDSVPVAVPNLRSYIVHNAITATVGGVTVSPLSFSIKTDMDSFCWQGSLEITAKDYERIKGKIHVKRGNEPLITMVINEYPFVIIAEELTKNKSFINHSYTLSGRSVTARLSADYATNKQGGLTSESLYASQLARSGLVGTGISLEYNTADWLIPKGLYSTDKTPIAIISDIMGACGGFIYSHPSEPKLITRPRYSVPAWELSTATPELVLTLDPVASISEQKRVNPRYDNVWLSSTTRLDKVYRRQEGQVAEAPVQSHELFSDQIATIAKGKQVLSDSGTHMDVSITTRWADKYALPLATLGDIWQIQDDGGYLGVVVAVALQVRVENDVPTVWQTVGIDRYLDS